MFPAIVNINLYRSGLSWVFIRIQFYVFLFTYMYMYCSVCCLCTYSLQFPATVIMIIGLWSQAALSVCTLCWVYLPFVSMNCHKLRLWFYIILLHVCASGSPTGREISQKLRCSLPWLLMSGPSSHFFLLLSKVSVTARVDAILLKRL